MKIFIDTTRFDLFAVIMLFFPQSWDEKEYLCILWILSDKYFGDFFFFDDRFSQIVYRKYDYEKVGWNKFFFRFSDGIPRNIFNWSLYGRLITN